MQWIIIMIYYERKPCWKTLLSPQILFCYLVPFVFFPIVDDFFKKRDWILKRHPGFKWVSSIVNWIRRDCIQTLNLAKKTNQCCGARKTDRTLNWDFSSFPCVQLRSIVIVWSFIKQSWLENYARFNFRWNDKTASTAHIKKEENSIIFWHWP